MTRTVARRARATRLQWRRRIFRTRDFLAFEAPRRWRAARRDLHAELVAWSTPQCALACGLIPATLTAGASA